MNGCKRLVDVGRRQFLSGGAAVAAGAATALASREAEARLTGARVAYPRTRLANVGDLVLDQPLDVGYPDADSPCVLIKLGRAVPGGVGPASDIVGFSILCPHKGFPLAYVAADKTLNCPGHYSRFDCEKAGMQIWGQATQNLPQLELVVDAQGDIHATGVDELIYGRLSNVLA